MKAILLAALTAVALPGSLFAQSATVMQGLEPDQRMEFRTYIQRERPAVTRLPSELEPRVGVVLPGTVELRTFPRASNVTRYRYVSTDDRILVVDPETRRVVEIIER